MLSVRANQIYKINVKLKQDENVEKFIREKLQNALNRDNWMNFKYRGSFSTEQTGGSAYALWKLQLINLLINVYN
jgi:hypothetical protein